MIVKKLSVLALVALFAGCVSEGQAQSDPSGPEGGGSEDQNGVVGTIISEELFPVIGATVQVEGGPTITTDEAGRFEVYDLVAGTNTLNISATGYEPKVQDVDVPSDGVAEVSITLVGIPGLSPYVSTLILEGYDVCSVSAVYSAGPIPNPCPVGERKAAYEIEVGADWAAGVHELSWPTNEEMIFASSLEPGCQTSSTSWDQCPALLFGNSPLQVYARPNDLEYASAHAINPSVVWPEGNYTSHIFSSYSGYGRKELNSTANPACVQVNRQFSVPESWGCPFGVGYSTGIRMTYYHTTFYLQAPAGRLEDFSAMPDA